MGENILKLEQGNEQALGYEPHWYHGDLVSLLQKETYHDAVERTTINHRRVKSPYF